MWQGSVVSIHIAPAAQAPTRSASAVRAVAGRGLEGDRYYQGAGTFSDQPGLGREVTLVEIEALEALERDYRIELEPGLTRRNIVTRGVPLNHLVGAEFKVGEVVLRGVRLCDPCAHMEKLSRKGVLRGMIHRGGLRAEIVVEGMIRVGDVVVAAQAPS